MRALAGTGARRSILVGLRPSRGTLPTSKPTRLLPHCGPMSSRTDDVRGSFTWSTLTTNRRRLRGNHPGAWASLRHSPRLASTRDAWILTLYARDPPTLRTARAIRTSLSSRVRVQRVDAMHSSWQLPPPESLMWPRASQRQIWPGIPRPPTIVAPVSRPSPERPPSAAAVHAKH